MIYKKLYYIGFVKNTHGINGFFEVKLSNDIELSEFINKNLFIEFEGNLKPYLIKKIGYKNKNYLLSLSGVNNINDIKRFIKCNLYISLSDIKDLNISIIQDISNFDVIDINTNQKIGTVEDINTETKNKFFIFNNIVTNKTTMIPLVDKFVIKIDYNSKEIFIQLIKGL